MIKNEINGDHRCPHMPHGVESLVHDVHPSFLGEDLEHGHESLRKKRKERLHSGVRPACN